MTVFGAISIFGWIGAFVFLALFMIHPSTRSTRKSRDGRIFWLFILADSAVMLMIYSLGLVTLFFRDWPYRDNLRFVIGVAAVTVVWWRVGLFVNMNVRKRRERDIEEVISGE